MRAESWEMTGTGHQMLALAGLAVSGHNTTLGYNTGKHHILKKNIIHHFHLFFTVCMNEYLLLD